MVHASIMRYQVWRMTDPGELINRQSPALTVCWHCCQRMLPSMSDRLYPLLVLVPEKST